MGEYGESVRADQADGATRQVALLIGIISSFLAPFMVSSINVALPTIAREFEMNAVLLTWVPMVYLISGAIFLVPFGRIADIYGRKKVFAWGIALFTAASLLSAFSTSGRMLIFCRLFQGIGGTMIWGTSMAILISVFPPGERGRVLGLSVAAVYAGLSVGPFVGGFMTAHLGWRSIFLLCGPMGLAILGLILWKLKGEWVEAEGEEVDVIGSIIYSVALAALIYGFLTLPKTGGFLFLSLGIAALFLFAAWENKTKHPLLDLRVLRHNRVFVQSNVAMFINYGATFAIGFLISLYLQYIKHLPPQSAGLVLIAQPVVQTAFSPYAGKLSDRVNPQLVASCGMGLTVLGLVLFTFLGTGTSIAFVVATLALHGFAIALFSSPNTNAVMGSVDKRFYGVASGIASTTRLLGNCFSIGTVMFVFAFCIGQVEITPGYYPAFLSSVRLIFIVFALLCAAGILASLSPGKRSARLST